MDETVVTPRRERRRDERRARAGWSIVAIEAMPVKEILVGTPFGCRVFAGGDESAVELSGKPVSVLARRGDGACVAIVGGNEAWQRDERGAWSKLATLSEQVLSLTSVGEVLYAGTMGDAALDRRGPDVVTDDPDRARCP